MKFIKRKKPKGTFYVDYFTQNDEMFIIFETVQGTVIHKSIGHTKCKTAELKETEFYVFISPIKDNVKKVFTIPRI